MSYTYEATAQPVTYDSATGAIDSQSLSALAASGFGSGIPNTFAALGDSITANNNFNTNVAAASISGSGNTVTVSITAHGRATGDLIRVASLTPAEYNGDFPITRVDANTITYQTLTPVTAATPTGTAAVYFKALYANNSWVMHANSLLGGRLNVVAIDGYPGDRIDQIAKRVGNLTALRPQYVAVMGGTNDFRNSAISVSDALNNLNTLVYAPLRGVGSVIFAMAVIPLGASDTPSNGLTVAQVNSNIVQFNEALRAYCASTAGVIFVDSHAAIVDATTLTGVALAAKLQDQIHPSPRGAFAIGQVLAAAASPIVKAFSNLPSSPADTVATFAGSSNVTENPLFVTGTGGTVGSGVTEGSGAGTSVAQNWRVQKSGTATCAASLVARTLAADGDTLGNNQRMTATFSASNDSVTLDSVITIGSRVASGDRVYAECVIKIAGTPSNLKRVNLNLNYTVGGVAYQAVAGYGSASNNLQLDDGTFVFRTPAVTIPAGAVTALSASVFVQGAGAAASFTIDVGRMVVRKVV